jgi:heme/copper-type cytochrome/quinol oxidase subunit 4
MLSNVIIHLNGCFVEIILWTFSNSKEEVVAFCSFSYLLIHYSEQIYLTALEFAISFRKFLSPCVQPKLVFYISVCQYIRLKLPIYVDVMYYGNGILLLFSSNWLISSRLTIWFCWTFVTWTSSQWVSLTILFGLGVFNRCWLSFLNSHRLSC